MSIATGSATLPPASPARITRPRRTLLPEAIRRRLGWICVLGALWFAGFALLVAHTERPDHLSRTVDRRLAAFNFHHLQVHHLFVGLADLGDAGRFLGIIVVILLVCALGRSWRAALATGLSLSVVLVAVEFIGKPLIQARLYPGSDFSFPSGHTASATCLGTMVVLLLGRSRGPLRLPIPLPLRWLFVVAGIVAGPIAGIAMIAIGAHSLTDVLGAIPLAVTLTLLVCAAVDRIGHRPPPPGAVSADQASPGGPA